MGKLSAAMRAKYATVKQPDRKGGGQKNRFPMPDANHARLALAMLDRAKGLSPAEKARIKRKAEAILAREGGKGGRRKRHAAPAGA